MNILLPAQKAEPQLVSESFLLVMGMSVRWAFAGAICAAGFASHPLAPTTPYMLGQLSPKCKVAGHSVYMCRKKGLLNALRN